MRALLVEDSKTSHFAADKLLRQLGYSVVWQRGAAGARGLLALKPFGVAIIDANIPEAEGIETRGTIGIELARDVRQAWPKCCVIVWSADPSVETFARKIGARFVLKGNESALVDVLSSVHAADPNELLHTIPARERLGPRRPDSDPDRETKSSSRLK